MPFAYHPYISIDNRHTAPRARQFPVAPLFGVACQRIADVSMAHGSAVFLVLGPVAVSIIFLPLFREALPLATLYTSFGFSLLSFAFAYYLIPLLGPVFVQRNLKGRDRLKPDGPEM